MEKNWFNKSVKEVEEELETNSQIGLLQQKVEKNGEN